MRSPEFSTLTTRVELTVTYIWLVRHWAILLILISSAAIYIFFPLQMQAMEPYAYAAAIEKYFRLSDTFALAQGQYLPEFGRFHPNHPIGHFVAAFAYDIFGISALAWIRSINISSAVLSGWLIYLIGQQLSLQRFGSGLAAGIFLSTHGAFLAVFSGEWHMPALALSLAGFYYALLYIKDKRNRWFALSAFCLTIAVCYHFASISYFAPAGCLLLFLNISQNRRRSTLIVGGIIALIFLIIYLIIPWIIFDLDSIYDWAEIFFIYKYLAHIRYSGLEWPIFALRTVYHSFMQILPVMTFKDWLVIPFVVGMIFAIWRFSARGLHAANKMLFLGTLIWWPVAQWTFGARANGLNGWLFIVPLLCIALASLMMGLPKRVQFLAPLLVASLFLWNFLHFVWPNHARPQSDIFLFEAPRNLPRETPVAFVVAELVYAMPEIWHAGSILGFRNQTAFLPCCGERGYQRRLRRWLRENPSAIIVTDSAPEITERFLRSEGFSYSRWLDRTVVWPASFVPATIFLQRPPEYQYSKRLVVWLPD